MVCCKAFGSTGLFGSGPPNYSPNIAPSTWQRLGICAQSMRTLCEPKYQQRPMMMAAGEGNISTFNETLAAFLITRPAYAYLGYGWQNCGPPNVTGRLPGTIRDFWQPMFELDVGEPIGLCNETLPGIFSRNWSKGYASLDCNSFKAVLNFQL